MDKQKLNHAARLSYQVLTENIFQMPCKLFIHIFKLWGAVEDKYSLLEQDPKSKCFSICLCALRFGALGIGH